MLCATAARSTVLWLLPVQWIETGAKGCPTLSTSGGDNADNVQERRHAATSLKSKQLQILLLAISRRGRFWDVNESGDCFVGLVSTGLLFEGFSTRPTVIYPVRAEIRELRICCEANLPEDPQSIQQSPKATRFFRIFKL